ncbi:MAG: hypothetical protein AAF928_03070 [Myxococcota bacterium]
MPRRAGGSPPPWTLRRWLKHSAIVRTFLTSFFVLFMLAAAHLFMVVINAAERAYEAPDPGAGMVARMFSDRPLTEEIEGALAKARTPEAEAVLSQALAAAEAGETVVLHTLPITDFIVYSALGLTLLGGLLLFLTVRLKSDAAQSIVGIFAGNLLWTGGIEYGLTIAARGLGVGKTVGVVEGQLTAIYGEYVLMKHTWGVLAIVIAYLAFLPSSRCPVFLVARRATPMMRGPVATGRIYNFGPRSAFQYTTTVWAFYLLLLWAYDEAVFGVYSLATKGILFASVAGSMYCLYRLYHQTGWGAAVRYAVGAMIVVWTPIEIFAKWGVMKEPWLLFEPEAFVVFFGGLAVGTWALWRAAKRRRRAQKSANKNELPALPVPIAGAAAVGPVASDLVVGAPRARVDRPRREAAMGKPVAV